MLTTPARRLIHSGSFFPSGVAAGSVKYFAPCHRHAADGPEPHAECSGDRVPSEPGSRMKVGFTLVRLAL
jgi:hypothetical protein